MWKEESSKFDRVFESRTLHSEDSTIKLTVVSRGHGFSGMHIDFPELHYFTENEQFIKYTLYPAVYEAVLGPRASKTSNIDFLADLDDLEMKQLCEILIKADALGWMDHIRY